MKKESFISSSASFEGAADSTDNAELVMQKASADQFSFDQDWEKTKWRVTLVSVEYIEVKESSWKPKWVYILD